MFHVSAETFTKPVAMQAPPVYQRLKQFRRQVDTRLKAESSRLTC